MLARLAFLALVALAVSPTIGGLAFRAAFLLPLAWAGLIEPQTADSIAVFWPDSYYQR